MTGVSMGCQHPQRLPQSLHVLLIRRYDDDEQRQRLRGYPSFAMVRLVPPAAFLPLWGIRRLLCILDEIANGPTHPGWEGDGEKV